MKVTIDIDMTPEEMRKVLGLPDMQEFQNELLQKVREQVEVGADGYDPMTLLRPYMPASASVEQFQRLMLQMLNAYGSTDKTTQKKTDNR